jgi:hypothetical protein
MSTYYETRYCDNCCCQHWVKVTRSGRLVCHGDQFYPGNTLTHYARHRAHGIELVEKIAIPLPLDWLMAMEAKMEEHANPSEYAIDF